jgi:hypothetical protein
MPVTLLHWGNGDREAPRKGDGEPAALFRETAEIQQRTLGPDHGSTLVTLYNLACVLATARKPDEAFPVLHDVVDKDFAGVDDLQSESDFRSSAAMRDLRQ